MKISSSTDSSRIKRPHSGLEVYEIDAFDSLTGTTFLWASEWVSERVSAAERTSDKTCAERSASDWPVTLCVDFISFQPNGNVDRFHFRKYPPEVERCSQKHLAFPQFCPAPPGAIIRIRLIAIRFSFTKAGNFDFTTMIIIHYHSYSAIKHLVVEHQIGFEGSKCVRCF